MRVRAKVAACSDNAQIDQLVPSASMAKARALVPDE